MKRIDDESIVISTANVSSMLSNQAQVRTYVQYIRTYLHECTLTKAPRHMYSRALDRGSVEYWTEVQ